MISFSLDPKCVFLVSFYVEILFMFGVIEYGFILSNTKHPVHIPTSTCKHGASIMGSQKALSSSLYYFYAAVGNMAGACLVGHTAGPVCTF